MQGRACLTNHPNVNYNTRKVSVLCVCVFASVFSGLTDSCDALYIFIRERRRKGKLFVRISCYTFMFSGVKAIYAKRIRKTKEQTNIWCSPGILYICIMSVSNVLGHGDIILIHVCRVFFIIRQIKIYFLTLYEQIKIMFTVPIIICSIAYVQPSMFDRRFRV